MTHFAWSGTGPEPREIRNRAGTTCESESDRNGSSCSRMRVGVWFSGWAPQSVGVTLNQTPNVSYARIRLAARSHSVDRAFDHSLQGGVAKTRLYGRPIGRLRGPSGCF